MAGGKRRAETHSHARPRLGPLAHLGGHVLGIIVGGAVWWYLVRAAIDFGRVARAGESSAWLFTAASSAGAVVCLLLVIVLVARVLVTLGVVSEYQPRRAAPRRRAEPSKDGPDAPPHRPGGGGGHRGAAAVRRADAPEADGTSG